MKRRFSLFCDKCEKQLVKGINRIELLSKGESKIKCKYCTEDLMLNPRQVHCPICGMKNIVHIPKDYQIYRIHRISYWCDNCDERAAEKRSERKRWDFWNYCDQYKDSKPSMLPVSLEWTCVKGNHRFLLLITPGRNSTSILFPDVNDGKDNPPSCYMTTMVERAGFNFLRFTQYFGFPRCNQSYSSWQFQGIGEILYCFLLGFTLSFLLPVLAFFLFGSLDDISLFFRFGMSLLTSAFIYFSYVTYKEIALVVGKLELSFKNPVSRRMLFPFFVNKPSMSILLFSIMLFVMIADDLFYIDPSTMSITCQLDISNYADRIRWLDNFSGGLGMSILAGLIGPLYLGFGLYLYLLWDVNNIRQKISILEEDFIDIVPKIEKLAEIAIYIIFFVASTLLIFEILVYISSSPLLDTYRHETMNVIFFRSLRFGIALLFPLVWYFLFLGKITSDLRAVEFQRIKTRLRKLALGNIKEEKQLELSYRKEIQGSFKWIRIVEYSSRFMLICFIIVEGVVLEIIKINC